MEVIGDDKRIRALFSEAKFADEQVAVSFTAVWNRAQTRALKPRRAFNLSFVAATALLVCALASLAIWSKYSQRTAPPAIAVVNPPSTSNSTPTQIDNGTKGIVPVPTRNRSTSKSPAIRLAAQRNALTLAANRKAAQEAKTLETWTSPTATLLSSSSDSLFKSLPQLNENAAELKSFLPNRENEKEK